MLILYQLEDVPIHFHPSEKHSLTAKVDASTGLARSSNFIWSLAQFQPTKKTVKGVLLEGREPVPQTILRLQALIGKPTELFAYEYLDGDNACGCCAPIGAIEPIWLQTAGVLEDIQIEESSDEAATLSLSIRHDPTWQPVNRWFWEWRDAPHYLQNLLTIGTDIPNLEVNLISWWSFEEASSTRYDWVSNYHLTPTSTPTQAAGKVDYAAGFSGSTRLSRADTTALRGANADFTIGAWVYLTNKTTNYTILSKWTEQGNQREYRLRYNQSADRFEFSVSNNGTAVVTVTANAFGAPTAATWYYIAVWHNAAADVIGISVNGTSNTTAHTTGVFGGTGTFNVASYVNGSGTHTELLVGRVDELAFWTRVLSASDILYLITGKSYHCAREEYLATLYESYISPYPRLINDRMWARKHYADPLIAYRPEVWAVLHTLLRDTYPSTGYCLPWTSDGQSYWVGSDPAVWNAVPLSLYAFRDLSTSGILSVTVTRQKSAWETEERVSTIDLADLNTAMASYGGISTADDVIVLGDYYRPPGFIVRAGTQVIEDVFPRTDVSVPFGRLGVGVNKVVIDPGGAELAALHTYRRY